MPWRDGHLHPDLPTYTRTPFLWNRMQEEGYYDQEINRYWGFINVAKQMNLLTQYIFLASKHWSYDGLETFLNPLLWGVNTQQVPNYQFGSQSGRASLVFLEECLRHCCNFYLLCNIFQCSEGGESLSMGTLGLLQLYCLDQVFLFHFPFLCPLT